MKFAQTQVRKNKIIIIYSKSFNSNLFNSNVFFRSSIRMTYVITFIGGFSHYCVVKDFHLFQTFFMYLAWRKHFLKTFMGATDNKSLWIID